MDILKHIREELVQILKHITQLKHAQLILLSKCIYEIITVIMFEPMSMDRNLEVCMN